MNKIIILLAVIGLWFAYQNRSGTEVQEIVQYEEPVIKEQIIEKYVEPQTRFKCDGRIYCSQMTSCAEATYFLRNCPGTKMDGKNGRGNGIPCERQWCH